MEGMSFGKKLISITALSLPAGLWHFLGIFAFYHLKGLIIPEILMDSLSQGGVGGASNHEKALFPGKWGEGRG